MTINQAYPSLDDVEPSWADISVNASVTGGALLGMEAIKSIKTGVKVELGERRGASGGRVMARTTGQGSQEASWVLYRSGHRQLIKALASVAPKRGSQAVISLVSFDIMVMHSVPGDPEIYKKKIKGCRYTGNSDDMKEGTDPDTLEITLNPIEIVEILPDGTEIVLL
jgi:hypothetical protein